MPARASGSSGLPDHLITWVGGRVVCEMWCVIPFCLLYAYSTDYAQLVTHLLTEVALLLDGLLERVSASSLVSPVTPVALPPAGYPPSSQVGMPAVGE